MIIRKFNEGDKEIFVMMCTKFYNGPAVLEPIEQEKMQNTFDYIIQDGRHVKGYIFEQDDKVAGYGLIIPYYSNAAGGMCGLLDEIYVLPEFRGMGIGSEYLDNISDLLGKELKALRLEVHFSNDRATKLYEKAGFKQLNYKQLVKETSN